MVLYKTKKIFLLFFTLTSSIYVSNEAKFGEPNQIKDIYDYTRAVSYFLDKTKELAESLQKGMVGKSKFKIQSEGYRIFEKYYINTKKLTKLDLISLIVFKKNNLNDKFTCIAANILPHAILIASDAFLESQRNSMLHCYELNRSIDQAKEEIRTKVEKITKKMNQAISTSLNINVDLTRTPVNHSVKNQSLKLLQHLELKKLANFFGIKNRWALENFENKVAEIASKVLKSADIPLLQKFVASPIFKKIKAYTNKSMLEKMLEDYANIFLPASQKIGFNSLIRDISIFFSKL